jgi:adenine-specific DNA glycosylase
VRRVVARARLGREPSDLPARAVEEEAERWLDRRHPDEWNQALMDLGRAVCRPRPMCAECPLAATCRFRRVAPMTGASRRQSEPFEGSMRQVRGAVVRALRARRSLNVRGLAADTRFPLERVVQAVRGLAMDGIVTAAGEGPDATVSLAP